MTSDYFMERLSHHQGNGLSVAQAVRAATEDLAVEAAIKAAGMEGWDHIDQRMRDALRVALPIMEGRW